jgi:hypothetical protein
MQYDQNTTDKLILSFSLPYQSYSRLTNIYHESFIPADWRQSQTETFIFDNLMSLRSTVNNLNTLYASYGIITILNEIRTANSKLTVSIIGKNQYKSEMNDIKLQILQNFSQISKDIITIDQTNNRYCYAGDELHQDLLSFITNVSNFNKCSIFVERTQASTSSSPSPSTSNSNSGFSSTFTVSIIGFRDQVKVTSNKLSLFIDAMNPQTFSDYLELPTISILPLICGTDKSTLTRIIKQTNCNIYLPNLLPELYYKNSLDVETTKPKIFITGLRPQVLLAKKWLADMISNYTSTPFVKQLTLLPSKREFISITQMSEHGSDYFDDLMYHTSCYISLPPLGSKSANTSTIMANISNASSYSSSSPNSSGSNTNSNSTTSSSPNTPISAEPTDFKSLNKNFVVGDILTIQGNSIEEIEILIDEFTKKVSSYYSECVEFTLQPPCSAVDVNKLLNFNDSIAFNSSCLVTCSRTENSYVFQILGNSENIKVATNCLAQFSSCVNEQFKFTNVKYQVELPNKEKDFIAGKKNGKIIKIINMSSVSIKLLPFNDQNFIVEISGSDLLDSILGLGLFEDELPTIYHFNVPESFHRQIIGVGGQTIQIIMRKFNVFVKFSNSFELSDKALDAQHALQATNFQQSFIRKNNVIIKCPSKNKSEIPLAKLELEKLVEKVKRNSYSCSVVRLSLAQWKLLTSAEFNILFNINRKKPTNFITELEKKTNTFINYPPLDSVSNSQNHVILEIFGIENNSKLCCLELSKIIPYSYDFRIAKDAQVLDLHRVLTQDTPSLNQLTPLQITFMNNITIPMKLLYNIELSITSNGNYDAISLIYYPHTFGYQMTVMPSAERVHEHVQHSVVASPQFVAIISGMSKFLREWGFALLEQGVANVELNVEDLGYKHHQLGNIHQLNIGHLNQHHQHHQHQHQNQPQQQQQHQQHQQQQQQQQHQQQQQQHQLNLNLAGIHGMNMQGMNLQNFYQQQSNLSGSNVNTPTSANTNLSMLSSLGNLNSSNDQLSGSKGNIW